MTIRETAYNLKSAMYNYTVNTLAQNTTTNYMINLGTFL